MEPRSLQNYGGPYNDEGPVENPETQMSSTYANKLIEDAAQLTRTKHTAIVMFDTVANAAVYVLPANTITVRTVWGDGASYKPVVTKTNVGLYTVAFSTSYSDGLSVSENVAFIDGFAFGRTSTESDEPIAKVLTLGSTTITLATYDAPAWPPTLADAAASTDLITVSLYLL